MGELSPWDFEFHEQCYQLFENLVPKQNKWSFSLLTPITGFQAQYHPKIIHPVTSGPQNCEGTRFQLGGWYETVYSWHLSWSLFLLTYFLLQSYPQLVNVLLFKNFYSLWWNMGWNMSCKYEDLTLDSQNVSKSQAWCVSLSSQHRGSKDRNIYGLDD